MTIHAEVPIGSVEFVIRFVLVVLATWRVTHLLAEEDGPADVLVRLRSMLGNGFVGSLMDCFNCLSLWIGAPAALFVAHSLVRWTISWLAISGAACLLQRIGEQPMVFESGPSQQEGDNDVLR
jgi:Protein of unknown function (DUF1360)